MATLEFKNLRLDRITKRGKFENHVLIFDEVSGEETITFAVDFVVELNFRKQMFEPVTLDPNSASAIKMFFKNTDFAPQVLAGFFKRQGSETFKLTDWSAWKVRETKDLF